MEISLPRGLVNALTPTQWNVRHGASPSRGRLVREVTSLKHHKRCVRGYGKKQCNGSRSIVALKWLLQRIPLDKTHTIYSELFRNDTFDYPRKEAPLATNVSVPFHMMRRTFYGILKIREKRKKKRDF